MTDALCGSNPDRMLREQASIIAEADLLLRLVAQEKVDTVERFRDPAVIPVLRAGSTLSQARARSKEGEMALHELEQYSNSILFPSARVSPHLVAASKVKIWKPRESRSELDAFLVATPDVARLDRYERRARSRRKRAMRRFLQLQAIARGTD